LAVSRYWRRQFWTGPVRDSRWRMPRRRNPYAPRAAMSLSTTLTIAVVAVAIVAGAGYALYALDRPAVATQAAPTARGGQLVMAETPGRKTDAEIAGATSELAGSTPSTPPVSVTMPMTAETEAGQRGIADSAIDPDAAAAEDPDPSADEPPPGLDTLDDGDAPAAPPPQPATPAAAIDRADVPLEKMVGQMLIVGFQGTDPDQAWPGIIARQLREGEIGGVIFLRHNFAGQRAAAGLVGALREAAQAGRPHGLLVLDQEGGAVQRLGPGVGLDRIPSAKRTAADAGGVESARAQYREMAQRLAAWGFDVNLGPVVDLDLNPDNPVIGRVGRSFSADPNLVVRFARAFIEAHRDAGVLTALKHFPGHGSSTTDSHLGFSDVSSSWSRTELQPFRELIDAGKADMVMTGHVYLDRIGELDDPEYPASLSPMVIGQVLRGQMAYDGVVISDDMEMGAIRKHFDAAPALIQAIRAGTDLLIVSNSADPDSGLVARHTADIVRAAKDDAALRARIEESYRRIVKMKADLAEKQALRTIVEEYRADYVAPAPPPRRKPPPPRATAPADPAPADPPAEPD
jgi:beta-N-acetylhexosaminidase